MTGVSVRKKYNKRVTCTRKGTLEFETTLTVTVTGETHRCRDRQGDVEVSDDLRRWIDRVFIESTLYKL